MEIELTEERIKFLEKDYCRGFIKSEIISQGRQILVAHSTVFDVRDTHEKMVSRSTITLMGVDANKLNK